MNTHTQPVCLFKFSDFVTLTRHIQYSVEEVTEEVIEVLSVLFYILSDVGGSCSSKKQTFDATMDPESCPPEVSKLECIFSLNII